MQPWNWVLQTTTGRSPLLEHKVYKKSKKDPTNSIDRKSVLLEKFPFAEGVCQQL
jgi:hypothetical protein